MRRLVMFVGTGRPEAAPEPSVLDDDMPPATPATAPDSDAPAASPSTGELAAGPEAAIRADDG